MNEYFRKTERIGFSKWSADPGDLERAYQLWGEKDVTRFICAAGEFTDREIEDRLAVEIGNDEDFHIQYWPLFELEKNDFIGCCGLRPFRDKTNSYEFGVHLRKKYWGRGYALEAATEVIGYCFDELKADTLFAGHHPQNMASKKLLLKLGFEFIGENFYEPTGLMHPSYRMEKAL